MCSEMTQAGGLWFKRLPMLMIGFFMLGCAAPTENTNKTGPGLTAQVKSPEPTYPGERHPGCIEPSIKSGKFSESTDQSTAGT